MSATAAHYRLRGEVGGVLRAYPLATGENWIGSMSGNAIVLPVRGVSRRHALVALDDDNLVLEDMGSKNGTLANGVRIQRTRLRAGDELRVGPVTLRVEAVEADDAALAIALGNGAVGAAGLSAHDTTASSTDQLQRPGLTAVEGLLRHLLTRPEATFWARSTSSSARPAPRGAACSRGSAERSSRWPRAGSSPTSRA